MTRSPRIVLMVPQFPQLSETFIVSKAVGLFDRGWDVHVVCGASPEHQWDAFGSGQPVSGLRSRVHVAPQLVLGPSLPRESVQSFSRLRRAPHGAVSRYQAERTVDVVPRTRSISRRVRRMLVDADLLLLDPDVVHFEFGSLAPGRMDLRARLDCAVTVSFRGYDLNYVGLDDPHYYQDVWDHADRVHLLGRDLWRRALHRGAPIDLQHSLIPPALDTTAIEPAPARLGELGSPGEPLRVLSVGRLHWKKGYEYALEALAAIRAKGIEFEYRIIGDGDLLEAVAFWRHQLGLDDVVELVGALPPDEVADNQRWADVFLHTATSEGFCNAVVEAQAHGVPVVCSDADGLAENIEDQVTGFVVPRRDSQSLADVLERLARTPELRAQLSAAGPERVERRFRLGPQLDAWEHFYDDALAARSQR